MEPYQKNDTIAAVSTPAGVGGIAVIRVSGPEAFRIVNEAWEGVNLSKAASHTVHLGNYHSLKHELLDQAVATIFRGPNSFTGEDVVEISVHGSVWIQQEVLRDLVNRGVRIANPGEFTQRAFINGKLDLAQAEGVADLISASSKAAHRLAIMQTRGTFSNELSILREKLIEFASLLELELDFSEEDVEFADRTELLNLCDDILAKVSLLADSYSRGAVLKNGVPVVIAGFPNAGKSSLLNLLIGDDKAIVTDIPGTTRDTIEDTVEFNGILYRFIDTAGLRETSDIVEGIGVNRAKQAMEKAFVVIWIIDPSSSLLPQYEALSDFRSNNPSKPIIILFNKSDLGLSTSDLQIPISENLSPIRFSTQTGQGLEELLTRLNKITVADTNLESDVIITNARHYEALIKAKEALCRARESLIPDQLSPFPVSADFIAQDIREAISHLSFITGSITSDTLLHSIFSRFCIGK